MKRLNKIQKEIEGLAKRVPCLTTEHKEWAKANANYFVQIVQGTTDIKCPNCEVVFDKANAKSIKSKWSDGDLTYVCPHCGAKIQVRVESDSCRSKKQKNIFYQHKQDDFFQVMTTIGGWQVTREFYMRRYVYVRKPSTEWEFYEVCQAWNNPKYDKTYFRALPKQMMSRYQFNPYALVGWYAEYDEDGYPKRDEDGNYIWHSRVNELEPRIPNGNNYFDTKSVAPRARILPYYKRRGLSLESIKQIGYNAMVLFQSFAEDRSADMETLLKAKEYELFRHLCGNTYSKEFFSAWKICQRNHYTPTDKREWIDLVGMLIRLGLDCHNARYVCPKDLTDAHDRLVERMNRKREREWKEEEMRRERELKMRCEKLVADRTERFGDFSIADGTLHSVVLVTYDDYHDEGKAMHHCVGGYFDHKNSLILSMRDKDDKRVETVEVDLTRFVIIQSRGVCNKDTDYHDKIVNLVNENMWQIRQRATA